MENVDVRAADRTESSAEGDQFLVEAEQIGPDYGPLAQNVFAVGEKVAVSEVVALELRSAADESKLPAALGGILVMDFSRNPPEIAPLRTVEDDSPFERLVLIGEVEQD